ncbi:hypothetical protein Mmc1_2004 [Magnetococcus marinus MC-1]|uniref:Uncharacterized protein n=1 Tax=Magnetococcus marinus (strain ATCC BAA-1437 / JCM 17883 / MC-1) TaxID=156889 RepID=A0L962_MAGMM|nr:hypothetical protein [Magnetococcus marinus]ABK44505.1 hypothetical protein Mmc1_2004 [Magnetococcus marinus MC-1]
MSISSNKNAVYIATTAGPRRVTSVVVEKTSGIQPVIRYNYSSNAAINSGYVSFLKTELFIQANHAYIINLDADIHDAECVSWQAGVYLSLALKEAGMLAEDADMLAEDADSEEKASVIWITGKVLLAPHKALGSITQIQEKLEQSIGLFEAMKNQQRKVLVVMPNDNLDTLDKDYLDELKSKYGLKIKGINTLSALRDCCEIPNPEAIQVGPKCAGSGSEHREETPAAGMSDEETPISYGLPASEAIQVRSKPAGFRWKRGIVAACVVVSMIIIVSSRFLGANVLSCNGCDTPAQETEELAHQLNSQAGEIHHLLMERAIRGPMTVVPPGLTLGGVVWQCGPLSGYLSSLFRQALSSTAQDHEFSMVQEGVTDPSPYKLVGEWMEGPHGTLRVSWRLWDQRDQPARQLIEVTQAISKDRLPETAQLCLFHATPLEKQVAVERPLVIRSAPDVTADIISRVEPGQQIYLEAQIDREGWHMVRLPYDDLGPTSADRQPRGFLFGSVKAPKKYFFELRQEGAQIADDIQNSLLGHLKAYIQDVGLLAQSQEQADVVIRVYLALSQHSAEPLPPESYQGYRAKIRLEALTHRQTVAGPEKMWQKMGKVDEAKSRWILAANLAAGQALPLMLKQLEVLE